MSQDRKFADIFLLVLVALIMISVGIFVLSSQIADKNFGEIVRADSAHQEQLLARISPVGSVRLPGDETEGAAEATAAATAPVAESLTGAQVYNQACLACHGAGIAGAPILGEAAVWAPRIAQGIDVLREHAIKGYQGSTGYMPPKGGRVDLSDQEIYDAIDFMVDGSR